jgi:hypothetical protein
MTRDELIQHLEGLRACKESIKWVKETPGEPQQLWDQCTTGGWLYWLVDMAGQLGPILTEYERQAAPVIRSLIQWATVEAALMK